MGCDLCRAVRIAPLAVIRDDVSGAATFWTRPSPMLGAETTLEIDSPDPPERVAKVVRTPSAAASCGRPC